MVRERDLLRWVADRAPIGDDCAVLECTPWGTLLVTTDSVIDGVHLHWDREGPEAFGYKAVARGMSDVAAMGGEPLWAPPPEDRPRGGALRAQRQSCRVRCRWSLSPLLVAVVSLAGAAPVSWA